MSKIKIALGIIVIVCIIGVVYTVIYNQPQGKPEFEIVNFKGMEIPTGYGHTRYQITFKLKNLGTEDATGINGTIKFGLWNETWHLFPEDYILKPGETSPWIIILKDTKPAEPTAIIIVECNEGVTQQFTEPLPA